MVFVAAAGSVGWLGDYWVNVAFPARHEDVIAVTAIDYDTNEKYECSHDGSSEELAAYHRMPSTGTRSEGFDDAGSSNSSNASSIVSGIATLVRSRYPSKPNSWVRSRLRYGAVDLGPSGRDWTYGYGIVNAYAAVAGFSAAKLIGNNWHDYCFGTTDRTCFLHYRSRTCFTENFRVIPQGDGPFVYQWNTGSTSDQAAMTLCPMPGVQYN